MDKAVSYDDLDVSLAELGESPREQGVVELIVRRPQPGERELVEQAEFSVEDGLIGDNWRTREYRLGRPEANAQITLMNSRVMQAITQDQALWAQAGDQLFVDFDLSTDNLPAGSRLAIGTVVLEVTALPHTGCSQFRAHFGHAALRFVNANEIKHLNRRGINARVVQAGTMQTGDTVKKVH